MKRTLFVLFLLFALIGVPAYAQDTTEAPTVPAAEVTTVPIDDSAVVVDGPTVIIDNRETVDNLIGLAHTVVQAVLFGGTILGALTLFLGNRNSRNRTEKLFLGTPPETQQMIQRLIEGYEQINNQLLDFLKASTDGKPNEETSGMNRAAGGEAGYQNNPF